MKIFSAFTIKFHLRAEGPPRRKGGRKTLIEKTTSPSNGEKRPKLSTIMRQLPIRRGYEANKGPENIKKKH